MRKQSQMSKAIDELVDKVKRLEQDNAELVEALEQMTQCFCDTSGSHGNWETESMAKAQAALAKAKGEE